LVTYRQGKKLFYYALPYGMRSRSKDNAAARRRLRRRIIYTLRKPTTRHTPGKLLPTKLAKESEVVL